MLTVCMVPLLLAPVKKAQGLAGIKADGDPGAETAKKLVDFAENPDTGRNCRHRFNPRFDKAIALLKKGLGEGEAQATTSTDFPHLIAIVEGRIDEALSLEDTEALKAIMAELDPKIKDPEFMQGQSPELQAKFKELIDLRKRYNDKKAETEAQKAIPEIKSTLKVWVQMKQL